MALTKSNEVISADYLKVTDLDNFFNIYRDGRGRYYYNLNSSVYFDIAPSAMKQYICDYDMHWPLISYKLYGTARLAWLLMQVNNVGQKDLFEIKPAGTIVNYIDKTEAQNIVKVINDYE